ncbi:uncharacterized protein [Euphorbia lathyris]|uniref:uncharacterized protein isoform X2 n=1 Tax=Euphorbia lathyris TaxID=212925 RepID=UPI003313FC05
MFPKSCVALSFLLLFLAFSSLSLSLAVPSTRSLKSTEQDPLSSSSSLQDFLTHQEQDAVELKEGEVSFGKTFVISGRMDLESLDYPGTGANNHHDPKTPGRA